METLAEGRAYIDANRLAGVSCPCCGRLAKEYRRAMNSGMARSLLWLVGVYDGVWVDVPKTGPKHVVRSREFDKLQHWGLVEQVENTDDSKRSSGMWRPTQDGIDFVLGDVMVASHMHIYQNEVVGWSKVSITIKEALGKKFDYSELMAVQALWTGD